MDYGEISCLESLMNLINKRISEIKSLSVRRNILMAVQPSGKDTMSNTIGQKV